MKLNCRTAFLEWGGRPQFDFLLKRGLFSS